MFAKLIQTLLAYILLLNVSDTWAGINFHCAFLLEK